ncbi:MAG TPA: hypothetical protein VLI05_05375 [Candidatus Saccharimonadia bacterium]|nr:hypothetical protein [Candidatus Saccharimonadia bacterium]
MPGARGKHRHVQTAPSTKEVVVEPKPAELTPLWLRAHFCDFATFKDCDTRHHGLIHLTADGQLEWVGPAYNLSVAEQWRVNGPLRTFHRLLNHTRTPSGKKSRTPIDLALGQAGVEQARAVGQEIYFLVHPLVDTVPA